MVYFLGLVTIGAIALAMFSYADSRESRGAADASAASELRWRAETLRQVESVTATLEVKWATTQRDLEALRLRIERLEEED